MAKKQLNINKLHVKVSFIRNLKFNLIRLCIGIKTIMNKNFIVREVTSALLISHCKGSPLNFKNKITLSSKTKRTGRNEYGKYMSTESNY